MRAALLALLLLVAAAPASAGGLISLGGPVTEIVIALGEEERLVAVDSTSRHPERLAELPDVGYVRALSAEAILSLDPELVLATPEAGPPAVLSQLESAGIAVVRVPNEPTPAGLGDKIRVVAEALGREAEGRVLAEGLARELEQLSGALAGAEEAPRVLFLLSISRGATLAAGQGTTVAAMIELAGGRNAAVGMEGYKPLNPEAAVAMDPELVLATPQTLGALGGAEALFARPELIGSSAARNGRLLTLDAQLLIGFGPRTGAALRQLAAVLHPALPLPEGE